MKKNYNIQLYYNLEANIFPSFKQNLFQSFFLFIFLAG
jgi:hypothetical protein